MWTNPISIFSGDAAAATMAQAPRNSATNITTNKQNKARFLITLPPLVFKVETLIPSLAPYHPLPFFVWTLRLRTTFN
jgi:hypothetical protein